MIEKWNFQFRPPLSFYWEKYLPVFENGKPRTIPTLKHIHLSLCFCSLSVFSVAQIQACDRSSWVHTRLFSRTMQEADNVWNLLFGNVFNIQRRHCQWSRCPERHMVSVLSNMVSGDLAVVILGVVCTSILAVY